MELDEDPHAPAVGDLTLGYEVDLIDGKGIGPPDIGAEGSVVVGLPPPGDGDAVTELAGVLCGGCECETADGE